MRFSIGLCFFVFVHLTGAQEPGTWPVDRLKSEVPTYRIEDESARIQSVIYEGEEIDGESTEVFAFYASPLTLGKVTSGDETFPGIVLVHGGGGTAFADWVNLWAERGYAAIAMDLSGHRPPAPEFDETGKLLPHTRHKNEDRIKLERGGLGHGHEEKFASIGEPRDHHWPFHAVANVMRAHTLLRSLPEVDPERTALTGISWGGYTTCLSASIDDRFKAAVPVYGCGFLHEGESVQKPSIDALEGPLREKWIAAYDPGSHLAKCTVPTLWVNGTHDKHYVLDSYAKSYTLVQGPRTIRIEPRMRHGHQPGWDPKEIGIFVDSIVKDGIPLAEVGEPITIGETVSIPYTAEVPITKAQLHFTTDSGLRTDRKWTTLPAEITPDQIKATGLPAEANTWFLTLTDERDAMVSSTVRFR